MGRYLWLRLAAPLTLPLVTPAAFAEDSTDQRLRTLERQLQQGLQQLDEQPEATKQAQQQFGEFPDQLERQHGHARGAVRG